MTKFIDAHVHGFPDRMFDAIWAYFIKNYWPINYKLHAGEIDPFLKARGAMRYTILNYAHKPGISRDMNTWTHEFGIAHPASLCFGTIHPEDPYIVEELERALSPAQLDLRGLKLQLLVTDFDPGIRALDPMYDVSGREPSGRVPALRKALLSLREVWFQGIERALQAALGKVDKGRGR
nr:hypothetical protein [Candidatus Sigynarchaeum springense]